MNERPIETFSKRIFIVACIPAFNEEETIAKIVILAQKHVDRVIVCDDGSTDLTGEIAERLGAEVIRHDKNMGYGAAIISLFNRARELGADIMVTLDADGQHNPEDIPKLLEPILNGEADIVIGSRFLSLSDIREISKVRRFGIKIITKMTNIFSHLGLTDAQSGFRTYSKKAIEIIRPTETGMGISTEILLKAGEMGLKIKEIPVKISYNVAKPSTHNPLYHGADVILSTIKYMSTKHPLLFYGLPGAIALIVAMVFWVWTFQNFALTRQVIMNITLVALGASIVALVLLTTAIVLWALISVIKGVR